MTVITALEVGLSFGANQGDRTANLTEAKNQLSAIEGVKIVTQSSLYETEPVGVKPQYQHMKFINSVLILSVSIPVEDLHKHCLRIEENIGRNRTQGDRYAPRPVDIDVLYAGGMVSDKPGLTLPHPQCRNRRFVLEPLAEVRPDLVLPTTGKTVSELVSELPDEEQVEKLSEKW